MGQTEVHSRPAEKEPPRSGYTWDDFVALPSGDRRELIDGDLVEIEVPTYLHEHVVAWLIGFLFQWVRPRKAGDLAASGYKVRISDERGVMPDLQFFRTGNPGNRARQGLTDGAPDLVVEVISESSARYDRVTKLIWYARIGCPEYWIVDPEAQTLERLLLTEGRYVIADALSGSDVFRPDSFPDLEIPLAELWNPPTGAPQTN
jgi:Uma2 family endonuclease